MIYKYEVTGRPVFLPSDSRVLTAAYQGDTLYVWVELGSGKRKLNFIFDYVGTGWYEDTSNKVFVGTVFKDEHVWHIFYEAVE